MRLPIVVSMILWATSAATAPAQSVPLDYRHVAGCYALVVGDWVPSMPAGSHQLPRAVRLDTTMASRGGRVLTPDIAYAYPSHFLGTPRWQISGDTVEMLWSNGYTPTFVWLKKAGDHLEGQAEARSDAIPFGEPPPWPRAAVSARRSQCPDSTSSPRR